ncbi:methylated-DNA--[protein]-cysteine S-methyltransferase [Roseibacterium sp. SDUM158016]|uniref:methylated-DNA--[protein]-cysteine S-methyltransferase n=1 Tax=Roseicyclus sediminis TaxID=2980997 RepID=UPI0021CFD82E|nr:methylated-DNA--[protein]-cysteine S-methyltransferase [Roseibacterium sp. SDUM158016]MCU4653216.1 methylated-DNA--[protein]-cysteine S-methyltransferase [Roseibacterium sp. SDUM158016]
MTRAGLDTPVGPVWVEARDGLIVASGWGPASHETEDPTLAEALRQCDEYFTGSRKAFDLPLAHGRSGLQGQVLDALAAIPFGETRTYGDLARDLGAPAQAIGQACGANPLPILIPCHRVLGAATLGGFSAPGGVETKVALLRHEGAAGLLI